MVPNKLGEIGEMPTVAFIQQSREGNKTSVKLLIAYK